jgi:hypothetical protein
MNILHKRFLLFLIGCIGIRIAITILAKKINIEYLHYMGYVALLPALGFLYIYVSDSRKTGLEVGGGNIWWNCMRPVHSLLYFLFAYNAIIKNKNAWGYLALDVTIGLIAFSGHHYKNWIAYSKL